MYIIHRENGMRTSEIAKQVKAPAEKPDDPSPILGTHTAGVNQLSKAVL